MIKIALSGKAKSGKNTVAEMIKSQLGLSADICAFADPIKEMGNILFPGDEHRDAFWGSSERREEKILKPCECYDDCSCNLVPYDTEVTYRKVLLDLGKQGRMYDVNIWIHLLLHKLKLAKQAGTQMFIVSDLRFLNEFQQLKKHNFITVRVKRKDINKIDDVSETEQDAIPDSEFDYIIDNNSTKEHLLLKVQELGAKLR